MKPSIATKFKVTPFNIQNGNKAPFFIVEPTSSAKRDEVVKQATVEFKQKSALSKYKNWDLEVEKI